MNSIQQTFGLLDLNTLHTPHKLAAFVTSILDEENNYNEHNNHRIVKQHASNNEEKDVIYNIYDPFQNENINITMSPPSLICSEDNEEENVEYSMSDSGSVISEIIPSMAHKQENDILLSIAKVLYEHSWSGEMISLSTQFSRSEYNALLNVANIPINSYVSNLVWKVLSSLQKQIKDDLVNDDKQHIKWYWWDSNDWKWRKYNVFICEWITKQYQLYLNDNNQNCINFEQCQRILQIQHTKLLATNNKNNIDGDIKNENVTIDQYFGKNNGYYHELVVEKDELNDVNILVWHKITNITDGIEYYREIRVDHKLFDVKEENIVNTYKQNPSPFAIPPQITVDLQ